MDYTVTCATPANGVSRLAASSTSVTAPTVEEAVRKVTGETPVLSQVAPYVWMWRIWTVHQGFVYAHPKG